jgi:asparaginyl-tRNA synthetase
LVVRRFSVAARATIRELPARVGETVQVAGWLVSERSSGKIRFYVVRDGTGVVQAVMRVQSVPEALWAATEHIHQEASLLVTGEVRADARAPGGVELDVRGLELVQNNPDYPITPKEHGVDFLMDHRHLWIRSPRQAAILRLRAGIEWAAEEILREEGFVRVDAPILTPSACEGTTTLFETQYFDQKAYLSQSGQLYNEATAAALGRVYCFGPTFRAEKSKTRRHLMEFWMLEPEMAFADLEDVMALEERLVAGLVARVLDRHARDLELIGRDPRPLEKVVPPFPRLGYDEALDLLARAGLELPWGEDFGAPHETCIAAQFDRPVFVHRYPAKAKAFYMEPDPERPELSLSVDLLAPEGYGEIAGGGQRIADPDLLRRRLMEHDLPLDAYRWYLDLRRWGSTPHSGFGLGIERTLAWIAGLEHVRETIPFARLLYRLYP